MGNECVRLEIDNGAARVELDRPDHGNAISVAMVDELRDVLMRLEKDRSVDRVVVSGTGADFCRGIDLRDFPADGNADIHGFGRWEKVLKILEELPALTIAAVRGECAGGGFQLALACDLRITERNAAFHLHEVRMGFLPGLATYRLPRFIGLGRAKDIALTGRIVSGEEAVNIGLADRLAEPGKLDDEVNSVLTGLGERVDAEAVKLIRRLMNESFESEWNDFLGRFLAAQDRAVRGDVFGNLVRRAHAEDLPRG